MASDDLGNAVLTTEVSLKGLDEGISDAEARADSGFSHIGNIISGALKVGLAAAAAGVIAFGAVLKGGIDDARAHQMVMAQTQQVITSMGDAAGVSAEHVEDLAASLSAASGKSLFGDDQVQAATNMLLTFGNIKGEMLDFATVLTVDMAQALKKTPEDMSIMVGKLLNSADAMSAAQRMGVSFSDEQLKLGKRLFETGRIAEYQQLVLDELNKEFGGQAEAAAKADGGWAQFHDRLGEAAETMGAAVLPLLSELAGFLNDTVAPAVEGASQLFADLAGDFQSGGLGVVLDDIREMTGVDLGPLVGIFNTVKDSVLGVATAFQEGGIGEGIQALISTIAGADVEIAAQLVKWGEAFIDWIAPLIPPLLDALGGLLDQALLWVEQQVPTWLLELQLWKDALWAWVESAIPPLLAELGSLLNQALAWVQEQAPVWAKQLLAWGQELIDWIGPMIPPALAELERLGAQLLEWIGEQAQPILEKLGEWASSFVAWIGPAAADFLARWPSIFDEFLTWIGEQAGPLLAQLGEWAVQFVAWIGPKIPDILVALAGVIAAMLIWIGETALVLGKKLIEWGGAFLGWVGTEVLPKLPGILAGILQSIGKWIGEGTTWAGRELQKLGASIVNGIIDGIKATGDQLFNTLRNLAANALQAAKDAIHVGSPSRDFAEQVGEPIVAGIIDGLAGTANSLYSALGDVVSGSVDVMADLPDQLGDVLHGGSTPRDARQFGNDILTGLTQGISEGSGDATGTIGDFIGDIGSQFERSDLPGQTEDLGHDLMNGLIDGMQSRVDDVLDAVDDIGGLIDDQFSEATETFSPSQMTTDLGSDIMLGLLNGLEGMLPDVLAMTQEIAAVLAGGLNDLSGGARSAMEQLVNDLTHTVETLPGQVHTALADAFDATADIDRQQARNIDAVRRLATDLQGETQAALDQALADAQQIQDPVEAAKFFKERSDQILELAKMQDQYNAAVKAGDLQRADDLRRQIGLIQDAQLAEHAALQERQQLSKSGGLTETADQLQQIINALGSANMDGGDLAQQLYELLVQFNAAANTMPGDGGSALLTSPQFTQGFLGAAGMSSLQAGGAGKETNITIAVDARGASDPRAVEDAGYRGAKRALKEAGIDADTFRRTRR